MSSPTILDRSASYDNVIAGRFQHAVFFTTGQSAAQARLWNNTIVETGRLTASGDASAVFINAATLADIRNNLILLHQSRQPRHRALAQRRLAGRPPPLGRQLGSARPIRGAGASPGTGRARASTPGGRRAARTGTSIFSKPPSFDSDYRVTSTNRGRRHGQALGFTRDYAGAPVPAVTPDIGAYQGS